MRCEDLTPKQYQKLCDKIKPMKRYLALLIRRMNKRQFPSDDALLRKVLAASAAIHDLEVHVHYGSCGPPKLSPLRPRDSAPVDA